MPTTTNFGWTTPADTDLVKDGAAAIRTLGSGIDTSFLDLKGGTTNQVLAKNSNTDLDFKWVNSGKLLQVISATTATTVTVASTTLTDSGLTASITPSATSSKILVLISQNLTVSRQTTGAGGGVVLLRGATTIYDADTDSIRISAGGATSTLINGLFSIVYLDSPSTTSSTTYKTQIKATNTANSGLIQAQPDDNLSSIVLMEIGA